MLSKALKSFRKSIFEGIRNSGWGTLVHSAVLNVGIAASNGIAVQARDRAAHSDYGEGKPGYFFTFLKVEICSLYTSRPRSLYPRFMFRRHMRRDRMQFRTIRPHGLFSELVSV